MKCHLHADCHVVHQSPVCPVCRQLAAKDEAISALSKLSEEEEQALAFLREPTDERYKQKEFQFSNEEKVNV